MALVPLNVWVTANFRECSACRSRSYAARPYPHRPIGEDRNRHYSDGVFLGHVDSFEAGSGAAFDLLPPENARGNYAKVVSDTPPNPHFPLGPRMSVVPSVKVR
jgi:membrane fusion protein, multidrug efflux system